MNRNCGRFPFPPMPGGGSMADEPISVAAGFASMSMSTSTPPSCARFDLAEPRTVRSGRQALVARQLSEPQLMPVRRHDGLHVLGPLIDALVPREPRLAGEPSHRLNQLRHLGIEQMLAVVGLKALDLGGRAA